MGRDPLRRHRFPLLLTFLAGMVALGVTSEAWANGGTLRLAEVPIGGYRLSVFTDPTPVRPDSLDVSVLVMQQGTATLAEAVEVEVLARLRGEMGPELRAAATREQADDPRYHAAKFQLGSPGTWEITVRIAGALGEGEAAFQVEARDPGILSSPRVFLPLALLPLLAIAGWIAWGGRARVEEV
jgi:hypothetical protein